jgi:hypothetical protein
MRLCQKKHIRMIVMAMAHLALVACQPGSGAAELIVTDPSLDTVPSLTTDRNLKVAFIGDSGYGAEFDAVLKLIKNEGADLVLHQGDFDYSRDPRGFFGKIDAILGPNFPYLASVGNHDIASWNAGCGDADGCYAQLLKQRMARIGITPDDPDLNDQMYAVTYRGLKLVFVGQERWGGNTIYPRYIQSQLAGDAHIWKICGWHKNQKALQLGNKSDEMGWGVYEICRQNGAIISNGHEHSYSRTKTLTHMQNLTVDANQHPLVDGVPSNPDQLLLAPGHSFVVVSGIAGRGMREQERCEPFAYPYSGEPGCNYIWAKGYTASQTGGLEKSGALFIIFNDNGDPTSARGYFKTSDGEIVDEFGITAASGSPT